MMKRIAIIVGGMLLIGVSVRMVHASDKPLLGVVIGANLADLVTTEMARASGNGREANPLLQNQKVFWGIKAGATTVESILVHQLWTKRHKGAAVAVALAIGGLHGWVAQHNAQIARLK
jgi:hypothetical protein